MVHGCGLKSPRKAQVILVSQPLTRPDVLRALILALAWMCLGACSPAADRAPDLPNVFDDSPSGFAFRYPQDWSYTIPTQGLLLAGLPMTLQNNAPGPTLTVQRTQPLSIYGSLEEALALYLRRGPLREDREWEQVGEVTASEFLGRPALVVEIAGRENAASPAQQGRVLVTTAANTFVYLFVTAAPASVWDDFAPTFDAIIESVEIFE